MIVRKLQCSKQKVINLSSENRGFSHLCMRGLGNISKMNYYSDRLMAARLPQIC